MSRRRHENYAKHIMRIEHMKFLSIFSFELLLAIFLFLSTSLSYATSVDIKSCKYFGKPKIIATTCSKNCNSKICIGKVECDLGTGPVILNISCAVQETRNTCPDAITCAFDTKIEYQNSDG